MKLSWLQSLAEQQPAVLEKSQADPGYGPCTPGWGWEEPSILSAPDSVSLLPDRKPQTTGPSPWLPHAQSP